MNWLAFSILAYCAVALQSGLTPFLKIASAEPNFGLVAVVFIAVYAQRQAVLLGAFVLGAMQDLATRQPFGLFAFSYGMAALAVLSAAKSVHRDHPLSHFFCALLAGLVTAMILTIHGHLHGDGVTAMSALAAALYTALLAPLAIGILRLGRPLFAFGR
jgi:rod shape-determining protein MreD